MAKSKVVRDSGDRLVVWAMCAGFTGIGIFSLCAGWDLLATGLGMVRHLDDHTTMRCSFDWNTVIGGIAFTMVAAMCFGVSVTTWIALVRIPKRARHEK